MNLKKIFHKPFVLTVTFFLITVLLGILPYFYNAIFSGIFFTFITIITSLTFLVPLAFLVINIQDFHGKKIIDLIFLYIEGVLLFGCAYFLISYFGDQNAEIFGMSDVSPIILSKEPKLIINSLMESIHFSLVTVSTVGYGNFYPVSFIAIALTTVQILLGLYNVVIGISSALSIVINKKIAEEEIQKKLPLKLAAYEDISIVINRFLLLFVKMHDESVPYEAPEDIKDFLTEKNMDIIYRSLDLRGKPKLYLDEDWWTPNSPDRESI